MIGYLEQGGGGEGRVYMDLEGFEYERKEVVVEL